MILSTSVGCISGRSGGAQYPQTDTGRVDIFLKRHERIALGLGAIFVAYSEVFDELIVVEIDAAPIHLVFVIRNPYRMMDSIRHHRAKALEVVRYRLAQWRRPRLAGALRRIALDAGGPDVMSDRICARCSDGVRNPPGKLGFSSRTGKPEYPQRIVQICDIAIRPPRFTIRGRNPKHTSSRRNAAVRRGGHS